jgi:hypothetical protein
MMPLIWACPVLLNSDVVCRSQNLATDLPAPPSADVVPSSPAARTTVSDTAQDLAQHAPPMPDQLQDSMRHASPVMHDALAQDELVAPLRSSADRPRTWLQNNIVKIKDFGPYVLRYDPAKRGFLAQVTSSDSDEEVTVSYKTAL